MKKTTGKGKLILAALSFVMSLAVGTLQVNAEAEYPSGTSEADITFVFDKTDSYGNTVRSMPIRGAVVSAYRVLALNEDLTYSPAEGLEDVSYQFGKTENQSAEDNLSDAQKFYEAVQEKGLEPYTEGTTDDEGHVALTVQPDAYGLYLIVQTGVDADGNADDYEALQPFLIQMPAQTADETWIYQNQINPKAQLKVPAKEIPHTPDNPPENPPHRWHPHLPNTGDRTGTIAYTALFAVTVGLIVGVVHIRRKKSIQ